MVTMGSLIEMDVIDTRHIATCARHMKVVRYFLVNFVGIGSKGEFYLRERNLFGLS